MRKVYFDHSATTPVKPEILEAMLPYLTDNFGNASSVHSFGRDARKAVDESRAQVAALLGCEPIEIFFTSGGTEADNMAILGIAEANRRKGNHIITSAIEHHAVLEPCHQLEKRGFDVTILPVDETGQVRPEDLKNAMRDDTILVTIMYANNEIGTVQRIKELAEITHEKGAYFHTDAVQAVGHVPINVKELGIDLLSLSGHKLNCPKGIGALYSGKRVRIYPITFGGSHERGRRPGTENVPGIVALGKACEIAAEEMDLEIVRLQKLRNRLQAGIQENFEHIKVNGHPTERLPGSLNVCFEFIEGESMLLMLDMKGIAASSGSACTSGSLEPSHVLRAIGVPVEMAHGSLRLTLGYGNTEEDVDYFLEVMPPIVERLRAMSPFNAARKECSTNV